MKRYEYLINGKRFTVEILSFDGRKGEVTVNQTPYRVEIPSAPETASVEGPSRPTAPPVETRPAPAPTPEKAAQDAGPADNVVTAPMPGIILSIVVQEGEVVTEGDNLLVLEAMKMENEIHAPRTGKVKKILVSEGTEVRAGAPLVEFEQ